MDIAKTGNQESSFGSLIEKSSRQAGKKMPRGLMSPTKSGVAKHDAEMGQGATY